MDKELTKMKLPKYKKEELPKYTGYKNVYEKTVLADGNIKITDSLYYEEGRLLFKEGDLISDSSNPDLKRVKVRYRWRTYHRLGK